VTTDVSEARVLSPHPDSFPAPDGTLAKDEASVYSGGRTLSWLKVKQSEYRVKERGWSQDVDRSSKE